MTDNETISKALGWTKDDNKWYATVALVDAKFPHCVEHSLHITALGEKRYVFFSEIPWDADLNLIHSAEDALTVSESETYLETLANIIDGRVTYEWQDPRLTWLIRHATAAQCARALAKVLGQRR